MTSCATNRASLAVLAGVVGVSLLLACSNDSQSGPGGQSNTSGGQTSGGAASTAGGASAHGGTTVAAGGAASGGTGESAALGGGAGAPVAGAASGGTSNAGASSLGGIGGVGGSVAIAQGGLAGGGSTGGASSVQGFTCNLVIGIDSTSEWFTGGFENQVPNERWEIIYHHPGYIEDWAKASDDVYKLSPTSPCAQNSDNPDRVIFNMFADTSDSAIGNKNSWATALAQAVTNLKAKYSRLKRVDLLTMTRAPNNTPCDSSNASGSSVAQYVDDAVMMVVGSGPPAVVAAPKFFAMDCNVFMSGGPHLSTAGKPVIAKLYGDYYSAEH